MSRSKREVLSKRRLFLCLFMLSVLLVSTGISFGAGPAGTKAYAVETNSNTLLSFITNSPGTLTSAANFAGTKITGADFLTADYSTLYLIDGGENPITHELNNALYSYNTGTGEITIISNTTIALTTTSETWSGLTGSDTKLYAASTNWAVPLFIR